jgi:hypothetical protein
MALFDDILSVGNLVTGVALGVGAAIILPLAGPILRPLAKNVIKGGILAYQGAAGLIEDISDLAASVTTRYPVQLVCRNIKIPLRQPRACPAIGGGGVVDHRLPFARGRRRMALCS